VKRVAAVVVVSGLVAATAPAAAHGGGQVLRSADVFHLQRDRTCHGTHGVTVRITPPEGVTLGFVSVRVVGRQSVRLTGVDGDASVTVRLPRDRARVTVRSETLDGQRLSVARRYRACAPPPSSGPAGPVVVGGGET
jgi:hypothetical protein